MNKIDNLDRVKINSTYLKEEVILEMREFFESEGFIQLNDFFEKKWISETKNILLKCEFVLSYKPIFYRRKSLEIKNQFNLNVILLTEYFKSKEFLNYLEEITQFELEFSNLEVNIYSHNDFTLLNDKNKREECLDVIFDLSDDFNESMGGRLTYLVKDEEVFYLDPTFNTLTVLYKSEEVMKYLKYINNRAKNNKILRFEISFNFASDLEI